MAEFSLSTSKETCFLGLLLSDFLFFCSFLLSHPLYFSYFIFFFPYLFKLLSFLSPLFLTTSLLLSALLTVSPSVIYHDYSDFELSESKVSSVFSTYRTVIQKLRPSEAENGNEEVHDHFEELAVYKIVFEIDTTSRLDIRENPDEVLALEATRKYCSVVNTDQEQAQKRSGHDDHGRPGVFGLLNNNLGENIAVTRPENGYLIEEENNSGDFSSQMEEFDDCSWEKGEREVKPLSVKSNKTEEQKEVSTRSGSKAMAHNISPLAKVSSQQPGNVIINSQKLEENLWGPEAANGGVNKSKVDNSQVLMGTSLGSFGSMRKEREWRRTLACKLFEERHCVDSGGEGMDLLWETYATDSVKVQAKSKTKKGKKVGSIDCFGDEEGEEERDGQLCCLQALKLSAGKMNLGMGRPNLIKITKALKGIGWLHHVGRHGKSGSH